MQSASKPLKHHPAPMDHCSRGRRHPSKPAPPRLSLGRARSSTCAKVPGLHVHLYASTIPTIRTTPPWVRATVAQGPKCPLVLVVNPRTTRVRMPPWARSRRPAVAGAHPSHHLQNGAWDPSPYSMRRRRRPPAAGRAAMNAGHVVVQVLHVHRGESARGQHGKVMVMR